MANVGLGSISNAELDLLDGINSNVQNQLNAKATSAQGTLADSAVQPGDLATVATSGSYNDLADKPSIPSTSGLASESYVDTAVADIVDSAPGTLDTLNELAASLGDDPNFATTVSTNIGEKVSKSGDTMSGDLDMDGNNLDNVGVIQGTAADGLRLSLIHI